MLGSSFGGSRVIFSRYRGPLIMVLIKSVNVAMQAYGGVSLLTCRKFRCNSKIFLKAELPLAPQARLWLLICTRGQSSKQPFPWTWCRVWVSGGGCLQVPITSLLQDCVFVVLCLEVTTRAAGGRCTDLVSGSDLLGKQEG